ncbi:glycosyltransferase [Acetivibrio cellulolyticus]|uniref:glycosyltransferase n=1 Tax=Acetivibrio cellulolyticus TaxID=35830 RepID=UPI0001E2C7C8|nr:UDP-glucose--sterol glucosyltransferase [Acetivibrio cellulolyticus]
MKITIIITPFIADQPFWGRQVSKLGLGTKPISYHKLSAEKLAELINICLNDENMKASAKEFGERIRSENGVEKAAHSIDKYLSSLKNW